MIDAIVLVIFYTISLGLITWYLWRVNKGSDDYDKMREEAFWHGGEK